MATAPLAAELTASLAESHSDQEAAQPVADHPMQPTLDFALEDVVDRLADKLAAFCFEHLEEVVNSVDVNGVDENTNQDEFEEELQVRF